MREAAKSLVSQKHSRAGLENNMLEEIIFFSLPICLFCGVVVYWTWILGLESTLIPKILIALVIISVAILLSKHTWTKKDLRWLISPLFVIFLIQKLPWWKLNTSWHIDVYYHLIQANNYIGLMDRVPPHQGMEYLFRPPSVPGFYSFELSVSNDNTIINFTPVILTILVLWQLQFLAERWTNPIMAVMVNPLFLILPVIRYWGQMPMTDVAAAGMWICCIHLILKSEDELKNKKNSLLLGGVCALTFLTKYVHLYTFGIMFWLYLKDKNVDRAKLFAIGWILIAGPFLFYNQIHHGGILAPLTPQTSFGIQSITAELGPFNGSIWFEQFIGEITMLGFILACYGFMVVFKENFNDWILVLVFVIPFVVIHAFILDWGEPRYQTPNIALAIILLTVVQKKFSLPILKMNKEKLKRFGIVFNASIISLMILISSTHFQTLDEEIEYSEVLIEKRDTTFDFYLNTIAFIPKEETILTGQDFPLSLLTNEHIFRYLETDDPINDSIEQYGAGYMLTFSYGARFSFESDIHFLVGHERIYPIGFIQETSWIGIAWQVNSTPVPLIENYIDTNAYRFGTLIMVEDGQYANISSENESISWVEVPRPYANYKNSTKDLLRAQIGMEHSIENGCINGFFNGQECSVDLGDSFSPKWAHVIYMWMD